MHYRNLKLGLALLMILGAAIFPLQQSDARQNENETLAYVYNTGSNELVAVTADGQQEPFNLGLSELFPPESGVFVGANDMAFDATGEKVAFCVLDYTNRATYEYPALLVVREIRTATNLLTLDLGKATACRVNKAGFDGATNSVFVSLTSAPNTPEIPATWRVLRIDAAAGTILNEVNQDSPEVATSDFGEIPMIADVLMVESGGGAAIFTLYPFGAGGIFEADAYRWAFEPPTITPADEWGKPGVDILPATQERVLVDYDPAFPGLEEVIGAMPNFNSVQIMDASGTPRTIYHRPDGIFLDAVFINDGQQVAAQFAPNLGTETPEASSLIWLAIDRTGTVTEMGSYAGYSVINNAAGGYVVYWVEQTANDDATYRSTFHLGLNLGGTLTPLWTAESPDSTNFWDLAWVRPSVGPADLPAFPAFSAQ